MISDFQVFTTNHFDRELKKLAARHETLPGIFQAVLMTLKTDPYNRSRQHAIKKLEAVGSDDGQYRIRSGRFRFRYDIQAQTVTLKACSLRREDTYR